ncbi:SGNH/GDSL hydrolase family protein [Streptomyces sp. CA-111067]|uniref:SGNH/GDSL hydrolase family protein n=1 Tax=Streptomyces sp. CA-111067 TaxID=3240046 RepID=UPI003D9728AF
MNPLLLPVVAFQGIRVRSTTEVLPPAAGPARGTAGDGAAGTPLRLAVLGESTAAGCGAGSHDLAFPGLMARELAARTGRPVSWEVVGQYGATARRIRLELLPRLPAAGGRLDVAVLLSGVNDVLTRRSPARWGEDLTALVDDLAERAGRVAVTGIPPFEVFPSLPATLGRYLAGRGRALDEVSRQVCARRERVTWVDSTGIMPTDTDFYAPDGFHPSAVGYRHWAAVVADGLAL